MPKLYDEETVLTRYVWTHYLALLTNEEKKVGRAIICRQKMTIRPGEMSDNVIKKMGLNDPSIQHALKDGFDTYRDKVRRRVLQDHPEQVFINRCPKCEKVVGTPKARLCKWCHHKWFDEA